MRHNSPGIREFGGGRIKSYVYKLVLMVAFTFYGSFEQMMDDLGRAMRSADSRVRPAQALIKPGHCFISMKPQYGLAIFSEILDHRTLGMDEDEQAYLNDLYRAEHMKFYRPVRAFSLACPFGEGGDLHLSDIYAIIDKELFDWYKSNGWVKPRGDPIE